MIIQLGLKGCLQREIQLPIIFKVLKHLKLIRDHILPKKRCQETMDFPYRTCSIPKGTSSKHHITLMKRLSVGHPLRQNSSRGVSI